MTRTVDRDLERLHRLIREMGERAEAILDKAHRALMARDLHLCGEVKRDDIAIDRLDVDIDEAVLELLATQTPVARDLRYVIAAKSAATDLERVGDLARNIATSVKGLDAESNALVPEILQTLARDSRELLGKALQAFETADIEMAREVLEADDAIDDLEKSFSEDALLKLASQPGESARWVELILIAKSLERVADHATNIAEEAIQYAEARNLKHADKLEQAG